MFVMFTTNSLKTTDKGIICELKIHKSNRYHKQINKSNLYQHPIKKSNLYQKSMRFIFTNNW